MRPFHNDSEAMTVGELTIENGDEVVLAGTLSIRQDEAGLRDARALRDLLADVVSDLESRDLPANAAETAVENGTISNPFG